MDEGWKRVGEHLVARRVELGHPRRASFLRSKNAVKFERIAGDLEGAVRDNYDPGSLATAEHLYEWRTGSIRAIRAGGEPSPLPGSPGDTPSSVSGVRKTETVKMQRDETSLRDAVRELRHGLDQTARGIEAASNAARAIADHLADEPDE